MAISRRGVLSGAAAGAVLVQSAQAWSADWPSQMLRVVVPRAPGGGTDILMRILSPGMQARLGQPFIIENKPDASAVVGPDLVGHSKPDGYTVLATDNAFYQNPAILKSLPYDTFKDFAGITMLAQAPVILVVNKDVPAKNLQELIAYAKSRPGKLTFGSGGIGASTHLAGVLFNVAAGTDIVHVPYRSSGPALDDLLGGHITMQFGGISSAKSQVDAGKLRAIALTGTKRDPGMPDVPTFQELGLNVDITSIWGMHAPAGTPLEIRRKLRDMLVDVMKTPQVQTRMVDLGYDMIGSTPEELDAETRRLVSFWIELAKKVNISAD